MSSPPPSCAPSHIRVQHAVIAQGIADGCDFMSPLGPHPVARAVRQVADPAPQKSMAALWNRWYRGHLTGIPDAVAMVWPAPPVPSASRPTRWRTAGSRSTWLRRPIRRPWRMPRGRRNSNVGWRPPQMPIHEEARSLQDNPGVSAWAPGRRAHAPRACRARGGTCRAARAWTSVGLRGAQAHHRPHRSRVPNSPGSEPHIIQTGILVHDPHAHSLM